MSIIAFVISTALTAAAPVPVPAAQTDPHAADQAVAMQPVSTMDKADCPMMKNGMGKMSQMGHPPMMESPNMMVGGSMHAMQGDCARRARHRHHKRPHHH